jgi:peptide/nickel transport system substrate-binding protein
MMLRLLICVAMLAWSAAAPAQNLRAVISTDIRGAQPGMSPDDVTGMVGHHIFEGLVANRSDGTVAPLLAERVETAEDGRSYDFILRAGVRFHNGAPLTADDVVWAWRRYLEPATAWPCRALFDGRRQVRILGIEAVEPLRVRFRLEAPNAMFLSLLARSDCGAGAIAHRESVGPDGAWRAPIGTGPFRLAEWRTGEFVELARFDGYASPPGPMDGYVGDRTPRVAALRLMVIPDLSAARTALLAGNVDIWVGVPPDWKAELERAANLRVAFSPLVGMIALPMNARDPMLRDPRVRRAINLSLDYGQLTQALQAGLVPPNNSPIPATSRYHGAAAREGYRTDLQAARALLREAGYRNQPITLITNRRFAAMYDTGVIIQQFAQAAGINVQLEVLDCGAQLDRYNQGNYQLITFFYTPQLDPIFHFDRFTGARDAEADKVWENPRARELLRDYAATDDEAARQRIYDELHRLFIADAPMILINNGVTVAAFDRRVEGYQAWPGGRVRYWNVTVNR